MDPTPLLKDINDSQQRADEMKIRQAQLETVPGRSGQVQFRPVESARHAETAAGTPAAVYRQLPGNRPAEGFGCPGAGGQKKSGIIGRPTDSPGYDRVISEIRAIRQAESNLRANIAKNRGLLLSIPAARATLDELEREKQSQKNLLETMLSRQGSPRVSKQMEV